MPASPNPGPVRPSTPPEIPQHDVPPGFPSPQPEQVPNREPEQVPDPGPAPVGVPPTTPPEVPVVPASPATQGN
jgi:hypothetical protein